MNMQNEYMVYMFVLICEERRGEETGGGGSDRPRARDRRKKSRAAIEERSLARSQALLSAHRVPRSPTTFTLYLVPSYLPESTLL